MKKTAITTAIMTLILIGTALAQPARKIKGSTAMGGGSGVGIRNRPPQRIGNPIGLDGNIAGVRKRQGYNLGDTATHEVGHKGKRRNPQFQANSVGDGTTEHFRKSANSATAQYNPKEIGIDKARNITPRNPTGFTEVTGLDIQVESRKARRKRHQ